MALATATADGAPSVRMVLLKGADERGFVFFTGYVSRKAGELDANPRAALLFHWDPLGRQVRVEGHVERVAAQESDAYFATRPRGAQLAAAASQQSSVLAGSRRDRHARRRARPRARRQRRAAARSLGRLSPRAGGLRVLAAPRRPLARSPALPPRERRRGSSSGSRPRTRRARRPRRRPLPTADARGRAVPARGAAAGEAQRRRP